MKAAFLFFFLVIIYSGTFAQEEQVKHKYALSFGIADNFRLDRFNMDIAVKKILDDNEQIRIFLSPRFITSDEENDFPSIKHKQERETSGYSIGAGMDYLWLLTKNGSFNLYGGPGFDISFGNRVENMDFFYDSLKQTVERKTPSMGAGLRGILGVEWMVSENIGIHSEYLVNFSYNSSKVETHDESNGVINDTKSKSSGFSLSSRVLFGLSIYL